MLTNGRYPAPMSANTPFDETLTLRAVQAVLQPWGVKLAELANWLTEGWRQSSWRCRRRRRKVATFYGSCYHANMRSINRISTAPQHFYDNWRENFTSAKAKRRKR